MKNLNQFQPYALVLLRIGFGLVILNFGLAKIFHIAPGNFTPEVGSLPWFAGLIELITGALLTVGLATRPAAFVLSGQMAVAYFMVHFPQSFFPTINGGYAAAVFSLVALYFVTVGAGRLSVDAALKR